MVNKIGTGAKGVVFVIKMKQFNIFLLFALSQRFCGASYLCLSMFIHRLIFELVCALFFGRYGMCGTISYLIRKVFHIPAGYSFAYPLDPYVVLSPAYGGVSSYEYWVHPFWQRLHGTYTADMDGGLIED
jgi:hypothetical protein